MNGYFQIISQDGYCAVKLFPPKDGGNPISREELTEYLSLKNISYDIKSLYLALSDLKDQEVTVKCSTEFTYPAGEYVKVYIAPDNMTVTARMIPPFIGGQTMPKEEFMREFSSRGIKYGFDDDAIDSFLANRTYCTDLVVARGLPPVHGTDASIEYFFNTNPKVKPTLNEDGTVDFFHLNTINHCQQGDLLARLTPATMGNVGIDVKGERIRPREVKQLTLKYGHNISINETKTEIRTEVSGHVNLVDDKVFVSNVFEVENVDNAVGNIDYDGNVSVNGNIKENFTVKAKGNIEVKGIVEGAHLEADGDIIIARGMNGMHKGTLKCKGNVVSKFLENCSVQANGYVECESIMHCTVISGAEIKVTGKKGFIAGGRAVATSQIEVKNLGSAMGADTVVEVGMDATLKQEMMNLQHQMADINKQLATIRPVLDGARAKLNAGVKMTTMQLTQIQKLAVVNREQSEKLESIKAQLAVFDDTEDGDTQGQVIVTGDVYPGTKICIGDVSMVVKSAMKYCRFVKQDGEVKMVAIY